MTSQGNAVGLYAVSNRLTVAKNVNMPTSGVRDKEVRARLKSSRSHSASRLVARTDIGCKGIRAHVMAVDAANTKGTKTCVLTPSDENRCSATGSRKEPEMGVNTRPSSEELVLVFAAGRHGCPGQ